MKYVNVTITVPEELRERMKKFRGVNWSSIARRAFEEEIRRLERADAARRMDELRTKVEGWSGVEEIRKWRDSRWTPQ